eukprot:CAMPEP_0113723652 /NCGR_PEP_ID=MMETSP0038_2-20120614/38566_1 /TAXON_ID=2898 /ORGANISM="Cryptomonas paramecium" /LENGTH=54 /DNA_ID=CAMNT_0000653313 /DNA_START=1 /DNA_END=162 /DNA_ORIENTATION=+ /assembly_acc=CAM_ASM_000170
MTNAFPFQRPQFGSQGEGRWGPTRRAKPDRERTAADCSRMGIYKARAATLPPER